jgi:hypothetical protein
VKRLLADHFKTVHGSIRLYSKGRCLDDDNILTDIKEAMLLFTAEFQAQMTGDIWIDECCASADLIDDELTAFETSVSHRIITSSVEAKFTLNGLIERIELALTSIDRVGVTPEGSLKAAELMTQLLDLQRRALAINLTLRRD